MPAAVVTGVAIGGSLALAIGAELPEDSKLVQGMFKTKKRAALTSTGVSLAVGIFCGPVAGVISEMITYPTSIYKSYRINKYLRSKEVLPSKTTSEAILTIDNQTNFSTIERSFR